jgi:ActR/RegA family two-component response regulator
MFRSEKFRRARLLRPDLIRPFDEVVREALESAMILCGGNAALAARCLRMKRTTLQSKLTKYVHSDA